MSENSLFKSQTLSRGLSPVPCVKHLQLNREIRVVTASELGGQSLCKHCATGVPQLRRHLFSSSSFYTFENIIYSPSLCVLFSPFPSHSQPFSLLFPDPTNRPSSLKCHYREAASSTVLFPTLCILFAIHLRSYKEEALC